MIVVTVFFLAGKSFYKVDAPIILYDEFSLVDTLAKIHLNLTRLLATLKEKG